MTPISAIVLAAGLGVVVGSVQAQGTRSDYRRAATMKERTSNKVFKASVTPHWFDDNTRFWYRNDTRRGGREFVVVDAVKGVRKRGFDHASAAGAL